MRHAKENDLTTKPFSDSLPVPCRYLAINNPQNKNPNKRPHSWWGIFLLYKAFPGTNSDILTAYSVTVYPFENRPAFFLQAKLLPYSLL